MPTVRRRDVDPETWAKLVAAGGAGPAAPAPAGKARTGKRPAGPPGPATFTPPGTWVIPLVTAAEVNGRDWRARSGRTQAARKAVSRAFGPHLRALAAFAEHYHAGGALRVVLTRVGGKRLDRSNLPTALKAVEDAVAATVGADDGDDRWRPGWGQEAGRAPAVRVELSAVTE